MIAAGLAFRADPARYVSALDPAPAAGRIATPGSSPASAPSLRSPSRGAHPDRRGRARRGRSERLRRQRRLPRGRRPAVAEPLRLLPSCPTCRAREPSRSKAASLPPRRRHRPARAQAPCPRGPGRGAGGNGGAAPRRGAPAGRETPRRLQPAPGRRRAAGGAAAPPLLRARRRRRHRQRAAGRAPGATAALPGAEHRVVRERARARGRRRGPRASKRSAPSCAPICGRTCWRPDRCAATTPASRSPTAPRIRTSPSTASSRAGTAARIARTRRPRASPRT